MKRKFPLDTLEISKQEAWALLERDAVLVTVNSRSARSLNLQYAKAKSAGGAAVFETPRILPWDAWLQQEHQERLFWAEEPEGPVPPVLLSPEQELLLWESIVSESVQSHGMLRTRETAGLAAQAWQLCRAWDIDPAELKDWEVAEYEAFQAWALDFRQRLSRAGWLDRASLPDQLADDVRNGCIGRPGTLILAGFDAFTPQQQRLLQVLQEAEWLVYRLELPKQDATPQLFRAQDARHEMASAAAWARQAVERNPDTRVGIIVPDLSRRKDELIRIFETVLNPEQRLGPKASPRRAFDVSLGSSLAEYPIVNAALAALKLSQDPLPVQDCLFWLHSPFFQDECTEMHSRCRVENRLRETGKASIPRQIVLDSLLQEDGTGEEESAASGGPLLGQALQSFFDLQQAAPATQSLSAWAEHFSNLLKALGWPGRRGLNSEEYQCLTAWNKSLQRFAALDLYGSPFGFDQALALLRHLLLQTPFQPEQQDVNVQILGLLEAVHEDFDQLWIMGLTDEVWPPAAHPHPLLPVPLQQEKGLPHSSAERELEYCGLILERVLCSAPRVVVSYPRREQDRPLFPSPYIARYPESETQGTAADPADVYWECIHAAGELEAYQDEQGPELSPGSRVKGGTGVLKAQSLCPFQAFARYRLGADDPREPVSGLDPRERGVLIHSALESFWDAVRDQARLLALGDEELQAVLSRAADTAFNALQAGRAMLFTRRFSVIEKDRVQAILLEWLEQERARPAFQVIGNEELRLVLINKLQFRIVVDRIDALSNGKILVVDYKTGEHAVRDWLGSRPAEPQVPVYSLVEAQELSGVYFGLVRKGGCRYIGIGEDENCIPGTTGFEAGGLAEVYGSWSGLLGFWKEQLEQLAGEFRQGWAKTAPLSPQKSCRNCTLQSLCRVYALQEHERYLEAAGDCDIPADGP